jgi:hypothetical protein
VKGKAIAGVAVGFVMLVTGLVLIGPTVVELIEGPQKPPPAQPIAPVAAQQRGPPQVAAAVPDAGSAAVAVAPTEPSAAVEPPPEKQEAVGFVTITSVPAGLKVALEDKELGKTPLKRVALPVGKQALTVTDAKGRKKAAAVTVKEGKEQKLNLSWAKLK